jgi:hypothetical protein
VFAWLFGDHKSAWPVLGLPICLPRLMSEDVESTLHTGYASNTIVQFQLPATQPSPEKPPRRHVLAEEAINFSDAICLWCRSER